MMQRPIITIRPDLLRYLSCNWDIDWRGQSASLNSGISRTVYAGFPRWVGSPGVFLSGAALAEWRAIKATAQGRRGIYRLPLVDPIGFSPSGVGSYDSGLPFSSGATFSNARGFAFEPFATCAVAVAKGATSLRVDTASVGVAPAQGQIMSAGDWPFMVTSVLPVSGTLYDLTVEMPLRAAIAVDAPILMQGRGLFEAAEEGMGNAAYDANRVSQISLSFVEVLTR